MSDENCTIITAAGQFRVELSRAELEDKLQEATASKGATVFLELPTMSQPMYFAASQIIAFYE